MPIKNNKYDCIVVGSGPGGAPIAYRLASRGMKVLILEAGKRFDPFKDYNLDQNNWEIEGFPRHKKIRHTFGKQQPLDKSFEDLKSWNKGAGTINKKKKRRYVEFQNISGVGGTSLHFQGEAHRLHPDAFRMKSLYGVANDWPLNYEDIEPYYDEVEKIVGVAGPADVPGRKRKSPYPLPEHKLSYCSQKIQSACNKLGYDLTPNSVAILSRPYRDTPPCNYCNSCTMGCPRKDKGSADVTFIPMAEKTGKCEIATGAFVKTIELDRSGTPAKARGVTYFDEKGKENFVKADYVVIACGAVETPRLLLNSEINSNGQVGQNFMETVFYNTKGLHPERIDSYRGIPIDSVIWKWNKPDPSLGFSGGFRLYPSNDDSAGPVHYALNYNEGWGKNFVEDVKKSFGHAIGVAGIGEFLPNKDSFITTDDMVKDEFGFPVAKIQSFLGESEIQSLKYMAKLSREILSESGVEETIQQISAYDLFLASHVFGTCRMGNNPESSVVDNKLRSHEVSNLLITDASVFPTSGGGDAPSLTIQALSLRAADLLVNDIKGRNA